MEIGFHVIQGKLVWRVDDGQGEGHGAVGELLLQPVDVSLEDHRD